MTGTGLSFLEGKTNFSGELSFSEKYRDEDNAIKPHSDKSGTIVNLKINSDLEGITSLLPDLFSKSKDEIAPVELEFQFSEKDLGRAAWKGVDLLWVFDNEVFRANSRLDDTSESVNENVLTEGGSQQSEHNLAEGIKNIPYSVSIHFKEKSGGLESIKTGSPEENKTDALRDNAKKVDAQSADMLLVDTGKIGPDEAIVPIAVDSLNKAASKDTSNELNADSKESEDENLTKKRTLEELTENLKPGISASGSLNSIHLNSWIDFFIKVVDNYHSDEASENAESKKLSWLVNKIDIAAEELEVDGIKKISQVSLAADKYIDLPWHFRMESEQGLLEGFIEENNPWLFKGEKLEIDFYDLSKKSEAENKSVEQDETLVTTEEQF